MPIYEFKCQACGSEVEVLQKISDPHLTDCEACGKSEMKKKVTAAAFRLSGAGWYETDFKEGDKKKNLTETATENKDSKPADAKQETKEGTNKTTESTATKSEPSSKETHSKESSKSKKKKEPSKD